MGNVIFIAPAVLASDKQMIVAINQEAVAFLSALEVKERKIWYRGRERAITASLRPAIGDKVFFDINAPSFLFEQEWKPELKGPFEVVWRFSTPIELVAQGLVGPFNILLNSFPAKWVHSHRICKIL